MFSLGTWWRQQLKKIQLAGVIDRIKWLMTEEVGHFQFQRNKLIPSVFTLFLWARDVPLNMCSQVFFPLSVFFISSGMVSLNKSSTFPSLLSISLMGLFECVYKYCWLTGWKAIQKNLAIEFEPDLEKGRILNKNAMKWGGKVSYFRHWPQHARIKKGKLAAYKEEQQPD